MGSLSTIPKLIPVPTYTDSRGFFSKSFSSDFPSFTGFQPQEQFWSISKKGTIRGMHTASGPKQQTKVVWVSVGKILDVVTDLRRGPEFGQNHFFELSKDSGVLIIPPGFCHGFLALEDNTVTNYLVDSTYDKKYDTGVNFSSIGFSWPTRDPIVSERDKALPRLEDFRAF
jgi:dTDP-4-dehydrorhamnose 3,5-epimerase